MQFCPKRRLHRQTPPPIGGRFGGGIWRSATYCKICSSVRNADSTAKVHRQLAVDLAVGFGGPQPIVRYAVLSETPTPPPKSTANWRSIWRWDLAVRNLL